MGLVKGSLLANFYTMILKLVGRLKGLLVLKIYFSQYLSQKRANLTQTKKCIQPVSWLGFDSKVRIDYNGP